VAFRAGAARYPRPDITGRQTPAAGHRRPPDTETILMQHLWKVLLALIAGVILLIAFSGPKKENPAPVPAAAAPAPVETRQTLRKTTQNVLELSQALADGGVRAEMSIQSQGLEVAADAYRTSVGKMAVIAVEKSMQLYQAEHDRKPKDYAEFMAKIIQPGKPDGLQLPMLPYYQEYAYDPETQQLVVVEFPAKKEQRRKETTGASGL
jgi:hypothetical protein